MDHVVYVDAKAKELENLITGVKTMILRGATGRKLPYGRVRTGDVLYFINNNAEGMVRAKGMVKSVINSEPLSPVESEKLIDCYQDKLQLTEVQLKRWAGKRFLVLIEVENIQPVDAYKIDKSQYGNMDDWLPVGEINHVKLEAS
jgi:hypothetical protein